MSVLRRMQRANNTLKIVKRVMAPDVSRPDKLDRKAKRTSHAHRMAKPVHFIFRIGKTE